MQALADNDTIADHFSLTIEGYSLPELKENSGLEDGQVGHADIRLYYFAKKIDEPKKYILSCFQVSPK